MSDTDIDFFGHLSEAGHDVNLYDRVGSGFPGRLVTNWGIHDSAPHGLPNGHARDHRRELILEFLGGQRQQEWAVQDSNL